MTDSRRPELPDPGEGMWWEIEMDSTGDFALTLYKLLPNAARFDQTSVVAREYVNGKDVTAERLETEASRLLNHYIKSNAFVGEYHRIKEN